MVLLHSKEYKIEMKTFKFRVITKFCAIQCQPSYALVQRSCEQNHFLNLIGNAYYIIHVLSHLHIDFLLLIAKQL